MAPPGSLTGDGGRRVVRRETDGRVTVLADRYDGKRLNSPNDLAIDRRGRIYFTDPRYSKRENMELDKEGVYRIHTDGRLTRIVDHLTRPNGIVVTRDARTLYVADNASPGGVVTLWAFTLDARRAAAALTTFIPMPEDPTNCTFGGPRRDVLYVTAVSSLYRIRTTVRGQARPPGK